METICVDSPSVPDLIHNIHRGGLGLKHGGQRVRLQLTLFLIFYLWQRVGFRKLKPERLRHRSHPLLQSNRVPV